MANDEHVALLKQGAAGWNAWRDENPNVLHPDLIRANLSGADLIGANLSGADLSGAILRKADLMQANLGGATLSGADLSHAFALMADFSEAMVIGADLSGAILDRTNFNGAKLNGAILVNANLFRANFSGANLSGASLESATLLETDFTGGNLTGCRIYGVSAWGLKLDGATQQTNLVITPKNEPEITVDKIEVAQFIYLMVNNQNVRDVIDTITSKAVLILGRFTPERKEVLDRLRKELRRHDRTPIIFDFDKPNRKNVTDTVKLLAQMARYIIVDVSDPNSAPYELGVISMLSLDSTPVVPLIMQPQRPFPMLEDVLNKPWCTKLIRYKDEDDLAIQLDTKIVNMVERKVKQLQPHRRLTREAAPRVNRGARR